MIGFDNTLLLLILAVILIAFRPWEHLHWLTLYILLTAIGFFMYKEAFPFASVAEKYSVYILLRYLNYFLFLGAVVEILRLEFSKQPWWIYPAFGLIAITVLFLPSWSFYFYIPRFLLFAGVASTMYLAVKKRNIPLFALSFMAIGAFVSDIVKFVLTFFDTDSVTLIQNQIDPIWSLAGSLLLIGGAAWVVIRQWMQTLSDIWSINGQKIVDGGASENVVVPFPKNVNGCDNSSYNEPDGIDMFLKAAAVASALQSKDFFSLQELAIYLSATPEYAEQFIKSYNVKKIYPVQGKLHWVVAKNTVDEILLGKRRS